jgi:N-acetylglucosaminyldiphosphoundecaprenol N-acetyl-beta-D-mannosaminyltransferase
MESIGSNVEKRFSLGNVIISITRATDALSEIKLSITRKKFGYISFMDMRTAYLANHDEAYRNIQNKTLFTFSDGITVLLYAKLSGIKEIEKISGKDFMDMVFASSVQEGFSHYFFGSTPDTIKKIQENLILQYPGISILGAVSPLFQPLEAFDIDGLANELNRLKPTFFWCGLGAPKQEKLIALLQPKLDSTICAGVGLAFEYIAGTVKRAPLWMHKNGLEWVFRLSQQPKNIRRIIRPLFWILKQLLLVSVKNITGNKRFY